MKAKERTLFDNYHTDEMERECREWLIENGNNNPSYEEISDEVSFQLDTLWEELKDEMNGVFCGGKYLAIGTCSRWDGNFTGGFIFSSFDELIGHFSDCGYFRIWDENGKLFLEASHHDGTDFVEIKKITTTGYRYYRNWKNSLSDHRTEREVHSRMFSNSHYVNLINFAHDVYGCPRREYEK